MENLEDDVPVRGKITKTFGEVTFNSNFDSGSVLYKTLHIVCVSIQVSMCPFDLFYNL